MPARARRHAAPRVTALAVDVVDRQRKRRVSPRRLTTVLRAAARALDVTGEVALVLTGDRELRALNARYRGKDRPTDVLSFPGPGGGTLGDIVISVETAERNAAEARRTLAREMDVLALHGLLHVLGYDHETDDGTMDRVEARLRRRLLDPAGRAAR